MSARRPLASVTSGRLQNPWLGEKPARAEADRERGVRLAAVGRKGQGAGGVHGRPES